MTMRELEVWMALEIIAYHSDLHRGIGRPPVAAWNEAISMYPQRPVAESEPAAFFDCRGVGEGRRKRSRQLYLAVYDPTRHAIVETKGTRDGNRETNGRSAYRRQRVEEGNKINGLVQRRVSAENGTPRNHCRISSIPVR
jgi:hypothetical protein